MGNEISRQLRSPDPAAIPNTLNKPFRSLTKMCQSSLIPDPNDGAKEILDQNTARFLRPSSDQQMPLSRLEIKEDISESGIRVLAIENLQADKDGQGKDLQTTYTNSSNYEQECEKKFNGIRETLRSLNESLQETRALEAEKSFRFSQSKTKNISLQIDLNKANKRNKNMLNLFRQNAVEIGFGRLRTSSTLPESLKKDVHRIWSQKYDILLEQNNQLKKEAAVAEFALEDKDRQIEDLQQRLLNLAEDLIQRERTIEKICTKFLSLKQRKDEQEILLRGSLETLQDALQKTKGTVVSSRSESSTMPSKDAIIARELRRSDRLACENSLLRTLLREAKRSCRRSSSSSTISLCDQNFDT